MNYWHLQMNPRKNEKLSFDQVKDILQKKGIIGMSEKWDNENGKESTDPEKFRKQMKTGDVVMIRSGKTPVALTQIKGDYFIDPNVDPNLDWFDLRREVKILAYYDTPTSKSLHDSVLSEYGKEYIQSIGTLAFCSGNNATNTFIKRWYENISKNDQMKDVRKVLEYKKQIILQGPPGTGKTRLAKQLAQELNKFDTISSEDITNHIFVDQKVISATGSASFHIMEIGQDHLVYKRDSTNTIAKLTFDDIINAFRNKLWEYNKIKNGSDTYSAAVALFLHKNLGNKNVEIIQFHPSYSYEDFVRGIEVENKDGNIEYKTKDKTIGEIAKKAYENYLGSSKTDNSLSKRNWVLEKFEAYKDDVQEIIDKEGAYRLNENVALTSIDEDAFRYKGDKWIATNPHRMKFKDIVLAYMSGAKSRQDVKKTFGISGSAKQHASYYYLVLEAFRASIKELPPEQIDSVKSRQENFVLIIDEINRANLSSVLGELIYALEYRGEEVGSIYSVDDDNKIILPPNLYIIGTMNTADRSVGHIDYAIRRRFAFVDVLPKEEVITTNKAKELFRLVAALFVKDENGKKVNADFLAPDFKYKDVQLGHSYFLLKEGTVEEQKSELEMRLKYEIVPILEEYVTDGLLLENAAMKIEKIANFEC